MAADTQGKPMQTMEKARLLGPQVIADICHVSVNAVYYWLRNVPTMPQPRYEIAGALGEDGERKTSVAWGPEQLPDIVDWHKQRKG